MMRNEPVSMRDGFLMPKSYGKNALIGYGISPISFTDDHEYIVFKAIWKYKKQSNGLSAKEGKMAIFKDRRDAGRKLAKKLTAYANRSDVIVLALPRGGVPVAYEVALALNAPLEIFIVRKLGLPGHEELAMGAIATGGARVINQDIVRNFNVPQGLIEAVVRRELKELERRERLYRGDRAVREIHDRTVILIDDGLATGASMHAAIIGLRARDPARIVIAVPTAALETCEAFKDMVDEIICATTPEPFYGVSRWYEDFSQTSDEEVPTLLEEAARQILHE
jgi:predicted phosphoribosyltransferase